MSGWFKFSVRRSVNAASPRMAIAELASDADKRIVLTRAALRAYPGTASIGAGPWRLGAETALHIRLHSLRAVFVAWCSIAFDGVRSDALAEAFAALAPPLARFDAGLPNFYQENMMGSEYAVAAWEDSAEAARRAVALAESIQTLSIAEMPFDANRLHADFLHTLRPSKDGWKEAQRAAISADCAALHKGMSPRELAFAPLWPDARAAAHDTNTAFNHLHSLSLELGANLARWLAERKDGALVFNQEPEIARERAVRTANLPPEFWTGREPADVLFAFDYCLTGDLDSPGWGDTSLRTSLGLDKRTP